MGGRVNPFEMAGRIVGWLDRHLLKRTEVEPRTLKCGCDRDRVIIGCLHCDFTRCEQHRDIPHTCVKESVDAY